jgi:hypothetical protein
MHVTCIDYLGEMVGVSFSNIIWFGGKERGAGVSESSDWNRD